MIIVIKPEHRNVYPVDYRDKQLQYVAAEFIQSTGTWAILATTPDGKFVSVKKEHVVKLTKLEVALG